jgi:hypothetical protein
VAPSTSGVQVGTAIAYNKGGTVYSSIYDGSHAAIDGAVALGQGAWQVAVGDTDGGALVAWPDTSTGALFVADIYYGSPGGVFTTSKQLAGTQGATVIDADLAIEPASKGAIATWREQTASGYRIRAQKVDLFGTTYWGPDGVTLRAEQLATLDVSDVHAVSDGAGGAIVSWVDSRSGTPQVYAQAISSAGAVVWTPDGVEIAPTGLSQTQAKIATDETGSAIVTWTAPAVMNGPTHIWALRLDPTNGAPSSHGSWGADGNAVCNFEGTTNPAFNSQSVPVIVTDGLKGAIILWQDGRQGFPPDTTGDRIRADGTLGN